jgi:sugar lactone lactonase YvrE
MKYSGLYNSGITVSISASAGAEILYSLDGSDPSISGQSYSVTGPIVYSGGLPNTAAALHVLKAIARQSGFPDSPAASATFIVDPWMQKYIGGGLNTTADGISTMSVLLNSPGGICLSAAGDLYVADAGSDVVRVVHHGSGTAYFVAGTSGTSGSSGDGGPAISALLNNPSGVAVNTAGELFIADSNNGKIRKVDTGGNISTVASGLIKPTTMTLDAMGNLYICDTEGQKIYKLAPSLVLSVIAGDGSNNAIPTNTAGDGGPALSAQFSFPYGIAVAPSGYPIYIADTGDNRVRRIDSDGSIRTIAGTGLTPATSFDTAGDGGPATECTFNAANGIALDPWGNLYVSDLWDHRLRKLSPDGIVSTVAGNGDNGVFQDGPLSNSNAWLSGIGSIISDDKGRLFLVDGDIVRRLPYPDP